MAMLGVLSSIMVVTTVGGNLSFTYVPEAVSAVNRAGWVLGIMMHISHSNERDLMSVGQLQQRSFLMLREGSNHYLSR